MAQTFYYILVICISCIYFCFGDISNENILECYKEYFNKASTTLTYEDGILYNKETLDKFTFKIEITIKVKEISNLNAFHLLKCEATLEDLEGSLTVLDNKCHEGVGARSQDETDDVSSETETTQDETTEVVGDESVTEGSLLRETVNLNSEVQPDNETSADDEQFVAIPRPSSSTPCIGCSTIVNPAAPGVDELANLSIRHLDKHEPEVSHTLKTVLQVERQVQVVNGVRYILTIDVGYSTCSDTQLNDCAGVKTCKISILEKPWLKMPNGKKFRAILANNCTEQWQYGDDGEVLTTKDEKESDHNSSNSNNIIKVISHLETSMPNFGIKKTELTDDELKELQEQIIPTNEIKRKKRGLVGGKSVKNPTDPKYLQMAQKALRQYLLKAGISDTLKVTAIDLVTEQVVSGLSTEIDFIAVGNNYGGIRCHSKTWERSWLNSVVIDINCNRLLRRARDVNLGGKVVKDPTDPKYLPMAEKALRQYVQTTGISDTLKVTAIDLVTEQVVSGLSTEIDFIAVGNNYGGIQCHSKTWERSWLNSVVIDINCDRLLRKARDVNPGGNVVKDPMDPKYLPMAEKALSQYVQTEGISETLKVTSIDHVFEQVVEGLSTEIHFIAAGNDSGAFRCISKTWERPWLNSVKIDINCDRRLRKAREIITGGKTEQDPKNPEYVPMAKEALSQYMKSKNIFAPLEVVSIDHVTTQVVAGIITEIDFIAGDNSYGPIRCHSSTWERSWLNSVEIDINCHRLLREARDVIPGGKVVKDPTDPKYLAMAEKALGQYVQTEGISETLKVTTIDLVTEQVVSGLSTEIDFIAVGNNYGGVRCHSKTWERSWLNSVKIDISCDRLLREAREMMVGGKTEQDPKNPEYVPMAKEALIQYMKSNNISASLEVVSIDHVTTQVVAGIITEIDFKAESNDVKLKCHSKTLEQVWRNIKSIVVDCESIAANLRSERGMSLLIGKEEKDPTDPKYLPMAEKALSQYLQTEGISEILKVTSIDHVTEQVVAGLSTEIDFIAAGNDYGGLRCHSKTWERPWLPSTIINITCDRLLREAREMMPGGRIEQDPKNPEYVPMAKEALIQYMKSKNIFAPLEVVSIDHVTTQVVAGIITEIDFKAESNDVKLKCHSKTLEQVWRNIKSIVVDCESIAANLRSERGMYGGKTEKDPTDPKYLAMAKKALGQYLQTEHISEIFKVTSIDHVTEQVVAGLSTEIDFNAVAAANNKRMRCYSTTWERPWLPSTLINITCDRLLREAREMMVGGKTEQDPKNPEFVPMAKEALIQYMKSNNVFAPLEVVSIDHVTTAVVAGIITEIDFKAESNDVKLKCHSETLEQVWRNIKSIVVNCESIVANLRSERGMSLLGGKTEKDPTDPKYLPMAEKALSQYLQTEGISEILKVTSIDHVTEQVVAGLSTEIDFIAAGNDYGGLRCHSKTWERPWLPSTIINITCDRLLREAREMMPGGRIEQDSKNPEYVPMAKEALIQYMKSKNIFAPLEVVSIDHVTTQVVAGIITEIDFIAGDNSYGPIRCHSSTWERSWLNSVEIDINCHRLLREARDVIPGGKVVKDPTDPKYLAMAEKALGQYVQTEGISETLKVTTIDLVTEQVVAGLSTEIDFIAVGTNYGGIRCHSKTWERSWLNSVKIDISCDRLLREAREMMVGGKTEQDPKNPEFVPMAKEALIQYMKLNNISAPLEVVSIDHVTTAVVAGLITEIDFKAESNDVKLKCHSETLEQVWLNVKSIDVDCESIAANLRSERGMSLMGGKTEKDPTDPKYLAMAKKALGQYLQTEHISEIFKVISIDHVTEHVVAGLSTEIDFNAVANNNERMRCYSTTWERPWLPSTLINITCDRLLREAREMMVGGKTEQDPKNPEFVPMAKEALIQYMKLNNISAPLEVVSIDHVTTAVVAGLITEIDFKAESNDVKLKCHSETLEQVWLNVKSIDVDCESIAANLRSERGMSLYGGKTEKDPTDPKYLPMAEKALSQYVQTEGISETLKVTSIDHVTEQVVEGLSTEIDFIAAGNDYGGLRCHSKTWERPWLNTTIINITCDRLLREARDAIPGGKVVKDPTDPKYLPMAEKALRQYVQTTGISDTLKVTAIDLVTEQVVSGLSTEIDFIAVGDNYGGVRCHSKTWERSWLNSIVIDVNCDRLESMVGKRRSKRSLQTDKPAIDTTAKNDTEGSDNDDEYDDESKKKVEVVEEAPDSPQNVKMIEKGLEEYNNGLADKLNLTSVINSTKNKSPKGGKVTQITFMANSRKYKFECLLEHFYKVPDIRLPTTIRCIELFDEEHIRKKRFVNIMGKKASDLNVENEDLLIADYYSNEALKYIEAKYRHPRKTKVVNIFSFNKKETTGTYFTIKMEIGFTSCLALSNAVENCSLVDNVGSNKFCRVGVWIQPSSKHPPRYTVACDFDDKTIEDNKKLQAEHLFFEFLTMYKPVYLNNFQEMKRRFKIFSANVDKIHVLNTHELGTARYAVTELADLDPEEFDAMYLGLKPHLAKSRSTATTAIIPDVKLPSSFDWREKGAVTEVKNQGQCGSCWAFSVTGNIEGQWKLKSGQLVSLSEQELVDCDTLDQGCSGGLPDNAYRAIEQLGGLELEQDYPYDGEGEKCTLDRKLTKVKIDGAVNITSDETDMAKWLVEHGPISIGINANAMQFYVGGVSHPWKVLCNPSKLDHGVLIVGYGIKEYPLFKKSLPYWIVKNSWGPTWGEQGYYRVFRGDGTCGVNQMASSAVIN